MGETGLKGEPGDPGPVGPPGKMIIFKFYNNFTIFLGPPGEAPPIPPEMLLEKDHPYSYRRDKRDVNDTEEPKLIHYDKFFPTISPVFYPSTTNGKDKIDKQQKNGKESIDDEFRNKLMTVYTSIYAMRKEIDGMKKPIGIKPNPARSCKDIYYSHPTFDDGLCNLNNNFLNLIFNLSFFLQVGIGLIQI